MVFPVLSYEITGACYEVAHQLGTGFLEKVYELALERELTKRGLTVSRQVPIKIYYDNEPLNIDYYADMMVNGVILELKHVTTLLPAHEAQLLNYMRATKTDYGMLINFGTPQVQIKRFINK